MEKHSKNYILRRIRKPNTECKRCGKGYYEFPWRLSRTKYCSLICSQKSSGGPRGNLFKKGGTLSESHKQKLRKLRNENLKEKAPNWKDGSSRVYKTGYYSVEYKNWRKAVFKRDNYICQGCDDNGFITAHHIKSFAKYPKLRFEIDNGLTLCEKCHSLTDNYKGKNKRKTIL